MFIYEFEKRYKSDCAIVCRSQHVISSENIDFLWCHMAPRIAGSSSIRQRYITNRLWRYLCSKQSETRTKYFLVILEIARTADEASHLREVGGHLHRIYPSFHAPDIRNEENLAMRRRAKVDTLKCMFSPLSPTLETRGHDALGGYYSPRLSGGIALYCR